MFGFSHGSSVSEIQQRSSSSRWVCSSSSYTYRSDLIDFTQKMEFLFGEICRCVPYRFKLSNDGKISDEVEVLVISSQKGHALMFPKVQ